MQLRKISGERESPKCRAALGSVEQLAFEDLPLRQKSCQTAAFDPLPVLFWNHTRSVRNCRILPTLLAVLSSSCAAWALYDIVCRKLYDIVCRALVLRGSDLC